MSEDLVGLFDGVTVLEIGQYVAAPIAAELFAHGGADVVKIERVDGDAMRGIIASGMVETRGGLYLVS